MTRLIRRWPRIGYVAGVLIAVAAVGGGWALAAGSGTLHGCAKETDGALRLANHCTRSERAVSWNIRGLAGAKGATGPRGPRGLRGVGTRGLRGVTGPQGVTGATGGQGSTGGTGPQGVTGAPGLSGFTTVTDSTGTVPAGNIGAIDVPCPTGETAISGGYSIPYTATVLDDHPKAGSPDTWTISAAFPSTSGTITAYVQCATVQ